MESQSMPDGASELITRVAYAQFLLRNAGIESMVIGGLAILAFGRPRFTQDAGLKVLLSRDEAPRLIAALPKEYKYLAASPEETLRQLGFVFVQDPSGVRIDLLLAETGFDAQAMTSAREVEVLPGIIMTTCSPEDLIIYKMISTRARDHDDVPGIIRRQRNTLDHKYIIDWLRQFEQALDDSTLVQFYQQMRQAGS